MCEHGIGGKTPIRRGGVFTFFCHRWILPSGPFNVFHKNFPAGVDLD
ncbi:MAG: hypothetical protein H3Z50_02065 [archaeon]|nr:hypothetical protein [archaeon]MCP8306936.1 hypothetical protein [archaeon]